MYNTLRNSVLRLLYFVHWVTAMNCGFQNGSAFQNGSSEWKCTPEWNILRGTKWPLWASVVIIYQNLTFRDLRNDVKSATLILMNEAMNFYET